MKQGIFSCLGVMIGLFLLMAAGCGPPADPTLEDLYHVRIPASIHIADYSADTFGMDPSFAWMVKPVDDSFLAELIRKNDLKKATLENMPAANIHRWPFWWNTNRIKELKEVYSREDSGLRHVFVDRAHNRIYIEFLGT